MHLRCREDFLRHNIAVYISFIGCKVPYLNPYNWSLNHLISKQEEDYYPFGGFFLLINAFYWKKSSVGGSSSNKWV
ncbi:hypothetical protein CHUAL_009011 [Chamberlinius hualienensis]